MSGDFNGGTASLMMHGSKINQTIGVGETSKDMHISNLELGRLSALAGMTLGSSDNGSITGDGISDSNSDTVGTITLLATKQSKLVTFKTTASSFNAGIVVQSLGGIIMSESVTTKNDSTDLITGTGTLTVVAGKSLSTLIEC